MKQPTRILSGLLCPVLLLASCAPGQKHLNSFGEAPISKIGPSGSERANEVLTEVQTKDESDFRQQTDSGPDAEQGTDPGKAEDKGGFLI